MSHKHGLLSNMHGLQMHLCDADGSVFGRLLPRNPIVRPTDLDKARKLLGALAASMKSSQDIQSDVPAGMTFLGQFIDHDITLDVSSELGRSTRHHLITNVRTPALDLDCVFGAGPEATPPTRRGPRPQRETRRDRQSRAREDRLPGSVERR